MPSLFTKLLSILCRLVRTRCQYTVRYSLWYSRTIRTSIVECEEGLQPLKISDEAPQYICEEEDAEISDDTDEEQPADTSDEQPADTSDEQPADNSDEQPAATNGGIEQCPSNSATYQKRYYYYNSL